MHEVGDLGGGGGRLLHSGLSLGMGSESPPPRAGSVPLRRGVEGEGAAPSCITAGSWGPAVCGVLARVKPLGELDPGPRAAARGDADETLPGFGCRKQDPLAFVGDEARKSPPCLGASLRASRVGYDGIRPLEIPSVVWGKRCCKSRSVDSKEVITWGGGGALK